MGRFPAAGSFFITANAFIFALATSLVLFLFTRMRGVTVETVVAELEGDTPGIALEPDGFDLVCDFYFLARERFPDLRAAVRPGGRFVAAIQVEAGHRFRLAPGELAALVGTWGWEIVLSREGATAEIVARRPR